MTAYVYTRRKDVKTVDGFDIVRFSYAYKPSWNSTPRYESFCDRMEAAGERAAEATRTLKYGVRCKKFSHADHSEGLLIFAITSHEAFHIDDAKHKYVGVLRKVGKKYHIEWDAGYNPDATAE